MKWIYGCLILVLFSCVERKPVSIELSDNEEELELVYVHWACECPNWIDRKAYLNQNYDDSLIYQVEAENSAISAQVPYKFGWVYRLKGRFYKENQPFESYEDIICVPTFRYSSIEVIDSTNETL